MTSIIRYRPLSGWLDTMFDDWDDWFRLPTPETRMPLMDLKEDEKSYTLTMEMPGIDKENVHIEVLKNRVFEIKGEQKTETEEKDDKEGFLRKERSEMSFYRSFTLPSHVDPEKIEAKHDNGILTVHIPKKEPEEEPKIKVEVK